MAFLLKSSRGRDLILLDKFTYCKEKELKNGETFWRCVKKSSKCSAKVYTIGFEYKISRSDLIHNHEANEQKIIRKVITNSLKRKRTDNALEKPSEVIPKALLSTLERKITTRDIDYMKKTLSYHRRKGAAQGAKKVALRQFAPLLVAMVGLPGRGKSVLSRRLARYLNYIGETTKVLDISEYRRKHQGKYATHEMFRADNLPAWRLRQQSVQEALDDAATWLQQPGNKVAILDGPNVSRSMRQQIYDLIYGQLGFRVMFIECVCEDPTDLERNFKDILKYSVDYKDMGPEEALTDLTLKMAHYRAQYESPSLGSQWELPCPMVKVLEGGHGGIVAHGVTGARESKILAYISTPRCTQQTLYFSRHGESEFNLTGRIGGNSNLSGRGRRYAQALASHVTALNLPGLQVWTSSLQRTRETAAGIAVPQQHLSELDEIGSGDCEGMTYEELQERFPRELALRDRDKLGYRYPQGESYGDVMSRLEPLLTQLECETNVLVISHQAVLRCILGYYLETPHEEVPYLRVPLHTIMKLTLQGHSYTLETIKMPIDCVDTTRARPVNCAINRSTEEALLTVPAHLDSLTSCT